MNNTILTDNKEIETLDLPSGWSDDFPCVATLLKTGFKGHRQLFAADVDVPITMFGRPRWSGPGRRFRYDFPALSSMIRGVLSPGTGTPDDR